MRTIGIFLFEKKIMDIDKKCMRFNVVCNTSVGNIIIIKYSDRLISYNVIYYNILVQRIHG